MWYYVSEIENAINQSNRKNYAYNAHGDFEL